jgi:hypothetical protein
MMKKVFVSHITEEAPVAMALKNLLEERLIGKVSVFASCDVHDLIAGDEWLKTIMTALKGCRVMLVICSRSSLTRPWINFEAGCGWIKGLAIIPVCHSGQRKDQLPAPFGIRQALQLEDENFPTALIQAVSMHCGLRRVPSPESADAATKLQQARDSIAVSEPSTQLIHSSAERTKLINADLQTLLHSKGVAHETVWTSAFLSTLAIAPNDCSYDDTSEMELLLAERESLLNLARSGCTIKCIISPANANFIRYAGVDHAIRRTRRLIELLDDKENALERIDWAVSEIGTKNLYIIGRLSCFEGYTKNIRQGYGMTLRQTSSDVINANIDVYTSFFKDLAARTLAKWAHEGDEGTERELLRAATRRCLQESLMFLNSLVQTSKALQAEATDGVPRRPA